MIDSDVATCPGCRSSRVEAVGRTRSAVSLFDARPMARCSSCELVFLTSQPTDADLSALNARYWDLAQERTPLLDRVHEAQMVSRVDYLLTHLGPLSGMKILDVGSGAGILNLALRGRRQTAELHAVESDEGCTAALRRNGAASVSRDLESCPQAGFDLAVLSHVLEHVADPVALLGRVRRKLAVGGRVFIEVPNQDYLYKANFGTHLLFFSPRSLRLLLGSAGFVVEHLHEVGGRLSDLASAAGPEQRRPTGNGDLLTGLRRSRLYRMGSRVAQRLQAAMVTSESLAARLQLSAYGEGRQWIRCLAVTSSSPGERT